MSERLEEIKEKWDWDKANPLEAMSIDDLQWLIQEAEENKVNKDTISKYYYRLKAFKKENKRYKQALEFYADFYKYNYGGDSEAMKKVSTSIITNDGGEIARQALEGESK